MFHMRVSDFPAIKDGDTLHLVLRLRGGGAGPPRDPTFTFAEMDNAQSTELEFADDAPEWRVAKPGICIEGRCPRPPGYPFSGGCQASGHLIIDPIEFGEFEVKTDVCKCPMCRGPVPPVTCGFTLCWWRYVGRKADGIVYESAWEEVGPVYKRFDEVTQAGID